ncbi:hypothetical protein [Sphingomonas sp. G-3-2-10]|uniref:hypothetical protein n=1 Tax=Sphingomonas sp. G-3-2-10 TaxID=2728838 RepID=UPI00146B66EC|nr:hypothetical protein [Sphingomonas sp. G-3-2-10]NML06079.1 hypothetical protein [Sphingomonas sp. G-3-2-10]
MSRPISRPWMWAALAMLSAVALGLGFVLFGALDKEVALWARIFLVAIVIVALGAAWVTRPESDGEADRPAHWLRQPRFIGFVLLALLSTFSVAVDILSQLSPRTVVEDKPKLIQETAQQTLETAQRSERKLDALARPGETDTGKSREKYVGLWGRDDCTVVFRLDIAGDALTLTGVKQPAGTEPYRLDATIVGDTPNSIATKGETGKARGAAGSFEFVSNGRIERLRWFDDKSGPDPTILENCDA